MSAALLLALLSATPAADAEARAQQLLNDAEFAAALKTLDAGLPLATNAEETARLQLLRGQCFVSMRKQEAAKTALEAALRASPDTSAALVDASPEVEDLLRQLRAASPTRVTLEAAEPADARVRVDGMLLGSLPLTTSLAAGRHRVEVLARGGERGRELVVPFQPQTEQRVVLELPALPPEEKQPETKVTPEVVTTKTEPVTARKEPKVLPWVGVAVGAVLVGGGGVGVASALGTKAAYDRQQDPTRTATVTREDARTAQTLFTGGIACAAVGAGAAAASILALTSSDDDATAAAATDGRSFFAAFAFRF